MKTKSFRAKEANVEELKQWAEVYDRSEGEIINEALDQYFEHQRWISQIVQEGLDELRAGTATLIPHEDVVAEFTNSDR